MFLENHCKTYVTESINSPSIIRTLSQEENATIQHPGIEEKKEDAVKFIDSQRPGLHISTILRQIMFDVLYGVEFVVLLTFGFSSDVKVRYHYQKIIKCQKRLSFINIH